MANTEAKPASGRSLTLPILIVFALVAVLALFLIFRAGSGGSVKLGADGVEIDVGANAEFAELLEAALNEDPDTVGALLNREGYFKVKEDPSYVDRLRDADVSPEVSGRMRQLLFDLSGPFALPNTFDQAKAEMIRALVTLDNKAGEFEPNSGGLANPFLTEIWRHNLERTSIFARRTFRADVTLLHGDPVSGSGNGPAKVHVLACRGSELRGKNVVLSRQNETGGFFLVPAEVVVDPSRMPCIGNARTLEALIANQTARFWMTEEAFAQIAGPTEEGATLPPRIKARFEVLPNDLWLASVRQ
ncbi:MAG: hypothetical protein AAGG56_07820 [Pseudomonadota bacterium]